MSPESSANRNRVLRHPTALGSGVGPFSALGSSRLAVAYLKTWGTPPTPPPHLICLILYYCLPKINFHSHNIHFRSTIKQRDFLSLQQRYWRVSRHWTRFSYSVFKTSRPRNDTEFPRNSSGSWELVFISKKWLFEKSSSVTCFYSQSGRDHGDEGQRTQV